MVAEESAQIVVRDAEEADVPGLVAIKGEGSEALHRDRLAEAQRPGFRYLVLVALGFAFLVSLAEFVSSHRWPKAYWFVMLMLDAPFTAWQPHDRLPQIVSARTTIEPAGDAAIWLVSSIGGIIAAKFGEVLLFGKSRTR